MCESACRQARCGRPWSVLCGTIVIDCVRVRGSQLEGTQISPLAKPDVVRPNVNWLLHRRVRPKDGRPQASDSGAAVSLQPGQDGSTVALHELPAARRVCSAAEGDHVCRRSRREIRTVERTRPRRQSRARVVVPWFKGRLS